MNVSRTRRSDRVRSRSKVSPKVKKARLFPRFFFGEIAHLFWEHLWDWGRGWRSAAFGVAVWFWDDAAARFGMSAGEVAKADGVSSSADAATEPEVFAVRSLPVPTDCGEAAEGLSGQVSHGDA